MNVIIKKGKGFNANEAKKDAGVEFVLIGNATMMWKKAECPKEGDELNKFIREYLAGKKTVPNTGFYIIIDSPEANKKMKPYKVTRHPNKQQRVFKTTFQIIGKITKQVYAEIVSNTINDAISKAKDIVAEKKENVDIKVIKTVVTGVAVAATVEYAPSVKSKEGTYIMFGIPTEI